MDELIKAAREGWEKAHAPYSGFRVGAAVRDAEGRVYSGCNIENSSYGLTLCAERVAIFKAVSEGAAPLTELCVLTDASSLTPPCGACRQIIWEFCGDIEILLVNRKGKQRRVRSSELLPEPFDDGSLR